MGAAPCNPQDALQSSPDGSQRHEGGLDRIRQVASMRWLTGEANQERNWASAPQALQSLNKKNYSTTKKTTTTNETLKQWRVNLER